MLSDPRKKPKKKFSKLDEENKKSWDDLKNRWDSVPSFSNKPIVSKKKPLVLQSFSIDRTNSMKMGFSETAGKSGAVSYTGDYIIGLGQMHKSNMIPITNQTDAIAIGKMRR